MNCSELEEALASDDPAAVAAARDHAEQCPTCRTELQLWDDLSAAARTLHREWDSPALWPRIVSAIRDRDEASRAGRAEPGARGQGPGARSQGPEARSQGPGARGEGRGALALFEWPTAQRRALAAALALLVLVPTAWYGWRLLRPAPPSSDLARTSERLLTEEALAEVEDAEAEYIRAIDRLSSVAAATTDTSASPMLLNLHERLTTIDAAIAECHAEIERNRFNAHLRNQLLLIYREKQHTLEQILEQEKHAS